MAAVVDLAGEAVFGDEVGAAGFGAELGEEAVELVYFTFEGGELGGDAGGEGGTGGDGGVGGGDEGFVVVGFFEPKRESDLLVKSS